MPLKGRDSPADRPQNELEGRRKRFRHCSIPKSIVLALLGLMARMLMMVNSDRWRRMAMKTLGVRRPSEACSSAAEQAQTCSSAAEQAQACSSAAEQAQACSSAAEQAQACSSAAEQAVYR